jgi:hypothetical protein
MVNNIDTNYQWQYRSKTSYGVPESLSLLVTLQIGVMDPGLHAPLETRLEAVSASPPVTCRIWLLRALADISGEGYIKLHGTPRDIEAEGQEAAIQNRIMGLRQARNSNLSSA